MGKIAERTLSKYLLLLLFLVFGGRINGQIRYDTTLIKPLPNITGWKDNMHYIISKNQGREQLLQVVDCRNGRIISEERVKPSQKKEIKPTLQGAVLPLLSPDKKYLAFLRNNNLYVMNLATKEEIQFTRDGSPTLMNGYASWVYYEEILKRESEYRAFWWSPDSKHIAFYRFDDSKVPMTALYNPIGQHGFTEITHYPKAGDPNPEVKLGIASVADKKVRWSEIDKQEHYLGTPFWRPDGTGLLVQWMPRRQNNLQLLEVDPANGQSKIIYREHQDTWIDWIKKIYWVKEGFFLIRDFSGWEQIYFYGHDGQLKNVVSSGKNWNLQPIRIDEKKKELFFTSNAENSVRTDLYRVQWNGKNQQRLTFGDFTHAKILLSPTGDKFITQYSNSSTPTRTALVNSKTHRILDIADSKGAQFDAKKLRKKEILWIKTTEGFELPASVSWPIKMDAGKRYPVIIRVYGGPKHQIVTDNWTIPSLGSEDEEAIKVVFEHRGSGNNGKQGLNMLYGNLGKWEIHDYINWVKKLRENPAVDTNRIFISGGSYGGYLTAMALTLGATYFNYGIADYAVTDWRLYDSHYTERYMGLPKDNPTGYAYGAVLTHINQYQQQENNMLMLSHGLMDDNVHVQNTYQLVDLLQRKNKRFELMIYPTERHGWKGPKIPFTVDQRKQFTDKYLYNK